jgi:FdhD protein
MAKPVQGRVNVQEEHLTNSGLPLAPESPVALWVDGKFLAILMCSPFDLDELAVGHLYSRGILSSRDDIKSLSVCPDMRSVKIATFSGRGAGLEPEGIVPSACGAAGFNAPAPGFKLKESDWHVTLPELSVWAKSMFSGAVLYRKTGGMHVAALVTASEGADYFALREDVGRHNAVDKVLGRAFFDSVDFSRSALLTSGRIAADMVQKAAFAGIPIIASRSIPTTEAFSIAGDAGITLVGRISAQEPKIYTGAGRIWI